ncbi:MAG: hypothetical protein ACKV2O_07080 [Acidimicrobiales bacterium]
MHRSIAVVGLSTALLVGGAAGTLLGQPLLTGAQGTTTTTPADTAATPKAPAEWMKHALAPLVKDGTITQAQADKVLGTLQAARPAKGRGGPGFGPGKNLDAVATALGMTNDEVATALRGGQTLGQLADSKGVSRTVVVDAVMAGVSAHLDEEVASGEHTQAEADAKEAEIRARITTGLDEVRPMGPGGRGHGGGRGGHRGPGPDQAPAAPVTPTTTS